MYIFSLVYLAAIYKDNSSCNFLRVSISPADLYNKSCGVTPGGSLLVSSMLQHIKLSCLRVSLAANCCV